MNQLTAFYFRHKKLFFAAGALALYALFVILAPHASAQGAALPTPDQETADFMADINKWVNVGLHISGAWLWPVIMMIGSLLDNDLIFGGAMGEKLLAIWVQIRNLVNIAFVLLLLAIAVYNVLGLGEEGGGMPLGFKAILPKFVLALVAVNFSFLAFKVVLDFTNVLTGAVFALPATVGARTDIASEFEATVCGTPSNEVPLRPAYCDTTTGKLNDRGINFLSKLDRTNITLVYALRFGKAVNLKFVRNGIKDIGQLAFNIIFNLVLYVVYAVSFLVLFLVLLFRLVGLWIGVVLSPLLVIGMVLPNIGELGSDLRGKLVTSALAPIKIGLVLSVGYIMLDKFEAEKSLHGAILSSNTLSSLDPNALPTDIHDLQQLMIAIAMVVIIWVGVFKMQDGALGSELTGMIKDKMQGFGKWVAKLPTYAQVIPMKGAGGPQSLAQMFDTGSILKQKFERKYGESPLRNTEYARSEWKDAAQKEDKDRFARAFAASPALLKDGEMLDQLKYIARKLDPKLFSKIEGKKDPKEIINEIYSGDGDLAKSIQSAIKKGEAEYKLGLEEQTAQADGGKPAAPVQVDTPSAAAEAIAKSSADELAGKGSFGAWSKEEIEAFKKENLPDTVRAALLELRDSKVVRVDPAEITRTKEFIASIEQAASQDAAKKLYDESGLKDAVKLAAVSSANLNANVKKEDLINTLKSARPNPVAPAR